MELFHDLCQCQTFNLSTIRSKCRKYESQWLSEPQPLTDSEHQKRINNIKEIYQRLSLRYKKVKNKCTALNKCTVFPASQCFIYSITTTLLRSHNWQTINTTSTPPPTTTMCRIHCERFVETLLYPSIATLLFASGFPRRERNSHT